MADSQLLTIVLLASVAGFFLFRLYTVLGRRTGHERPPHDYMASHPAEAVATTPAINPPAPERPSDPIASGLFDIALADRGFDKDQFLKGARAAYEMILTAFAAGDRQTLQPLLSPTVYAAFDTAITARTTAGNTLAITLVGFTDVKITMATLKNFHAEITLTFATRLISVTTDKAGKVVEGDAAAVNDVTDIWTFCRDVRSHDPNWLLVATTGEAH